MDLPQNVVEEFDSCNVVFAVDESSARQFERQRATVSNNDRNAVPAACVACRSKHLKCDGKNPCSRCSVYSLECTYVRSRRGYKGPRRNTRLAGGASRASTSSGVSTAAVDNFLTEVKLNSPLAELGFSPSDVSIGNGNSLALTGSTNQQAALEVDHRSGSQRSSISDLRERCLEAFFHYFSPTHPFVLPKSYLTDLLKTRSLSHLEAAMKYVGSHYVKTAPTELFAREVAQALSTKSCVRDGFMVQALLLFAIGLDGDNELTRAVEYLTEAEDLAIEIGMHRNNFAALQGEGIDSIEESWRRTWWELYVVDGMIAGVHQQTSFRLNEIASDVLLPCEEDEWSSGRIPIPRSLDELEDQSFIDDNVNFSSFAYRIAAVRNLGRVLQLQNITFHDDPIIDKTDAYLVNWEMHLPEWKKLAIDGEGRVDEMLFQAQMINNATTIHLHKPHSQLDTSVVRSVTSCAPYRPVPAGQLYNIHAAKIINSSEKISKLITLPVPLIHHTHFFTCVITLASIIHLSCWAALLPLSQDEGLKQQLRLTTGALKTLSEVWPSATRVGDQVKGVAQGVLVSRKLAADEGFWGSFSEEDMMKSMIEDEVIINSFQ